MSLVFVHDTESKKSNVLTKQSGLVIIKEVYIDVLLLCIWC